MHVIKLWIYEIPEKPPIDSHFLPLSLLHKKGAKLYPYLDVITLLIFMFPKMNNFCCSTPVIKRNRRFDPQKDCDGGRETS